MKYVNWFCPTKRICAARDLAIVRPLPMTKNTEILLMNEITASAWERSKNRWRFRKSPAGS